MFDLNGSDWNWLVYADYLEDQDIDATHIREGVEEQQVNDWLYTANNGGKVGAYFTDTYLRATTGVGGFGGYSSNVGPPYYAWGKVGTETTFGHGVGGDWRPIGGGT